MKNTFISSRLDYCNSLLYRSPISPINYKYRVTYSNIETYTVYSKYIFAVILNRTRKCFSFVFNLPITTLVSNGLSSEVFFAEPEDRKIVTSVTSYNITSTPN
jgi:uncharacterized protein (DUF1810 family)